MVLMFMSTIASIAIALTLEDLSFIQGFFLLTLVAVMALFTWGVVGWRRR